MPPTKTHHPKHAKKASAGGVGGRRKPKARAKLPRPDGPDEDDSDEDVLGEAPAGEDSTLNRLSLEVQERRGEGWDGPELQVSSAGMIPVHLRRAQSAIL